MQTQTLYQRWSNPSARLGIHHAVSSPYSHQSNGKVEAYVNSVKRKIKKMSWNYIWYIYVCMCICVSLLQVTSSPISPRLPSLPTFMFNRPTRDRLPRSNRWPILCDDDESSLTGLMIRQPQLNDDIDTHKNIPFIPTRSTVAVQKEGSRLWMHGTIVWHKTQDHNGRSYKTRVTKTGGTLPRTKKCVKAIPISAKDYIRNEMIRHNQPKTDGKCTDLIYHFVKLNKHEHSNAVEMEKKETMANTCTMQLPRYTKLEHSVTVRQKGNRIKDIQDHNKPTHNQETLAMTRSG